MSTLKSLIQEICPQAVFQETENAPLQVCLPPAELAKLLTPLHEDARMRFDYLEDLVGMDFGEQLGVVYRLYSTELKHRIVIECRAESREEPELPTLSHIWAIANFYEREVFDFFGIHFIGHPDMRRLFLRGDHVGYPLRKDYDMNANPLKLDAEELPDDTSVFVDHDGKTEIEGHTLFEKDEYVVNIGPQHPATHGVLHFQVSLQGEIVKKVDVHCGYIHRGIEKMCEEMTYPQTLAMTDRLDYLSAHQNRHALCACIEDAMGLEVPRRAQYIRVLMDELSRIQSHLLFYATFCMDLGALTPFFYGFRDREKILNIFEDTTGGRLIQNYNVIGGVARDLHPDFIRKTREFVEYLPGVLKEYHDVFTGNVIFKQRSKGIGLLSKEQALSFGISGPTARASDVACDVRKHNPYSIYDEILFKEILYKNGDCLDRYMVRMDEIEQSLSIISQLLDKIPQGDYCAKTKPVIKLPEGRFFKSVETARGEFGVFIESRGEKYPYRLKFHPPCLPLVSVIDTLASGNKIADLITIGASLDYVVPDIDR
ncbi:MAG: NADH-quinone oxidoreductase subunit D [Bacteroides sp.]|nr:NADH-quinone oxidoreductase subunit D [Ruminococcus flavefaciens]MCM1554557.1 NADH-quinone oxidoreductase subunit D [Bacteroides sp.]